MKKLAQHLTYLRALKNEYVFLALSFVVFIGLSFYNIFTENPFYYFAADVSELYFPWWTYINQQLHTFTLPLRNDSYFMGSIPLLAKGDASVLYPIHLISHLFFDASKNLNTSFFIFFGQQLFHYLLAGVFFYAFLRRGLRMNRWAAYLGSTVYVFSGSYMAHYVHPLFQYSLTWYPLLFLCYFLFLEKRNMLYALLGSGVIAVIIVSGHTQIVYYFLGFFVVATFYLLLTESNGKRYKLIIPTVGMIVLGMLLASVQLLPTLEFTKYVARPAPETTIQSLYNSLHPLYYLTLFVPKLYGQHREGYWGSDLPWGNWENYLYIGVISSLALLCSLWWRPIRYRILFLILTIFPLVMSFGRFWWLSAWINQHMPYGDTLTWINRMTMPFHFAVSILVGGGFHVILSERKRWLSVMPMVLGMLGIGVILGIFVRNPEFVYQLQPAGRAPDSSEAFLRAFGSVQRSLVFFGFSFIAMCAYILSRRRIIIFCIVFILVVDLLPLGQSYNPIEPSNGAPETYLGETSTLWFLKNQNDIFRVDGLGPRNVGMIYAIETVSGYSTILTRAYQDIAPYLAADYPNVFNMANIKYIVSNDPQIPQDRFLRIDDTLWENTQVFPRVFFVPSYQYVNSEEEMISKLISPTFNPRQYVLFYPDVPKPQLDVTEDMINPTIDVQRNGQDIQVSIETTHDGFLFLGELQYPGWRAIVDGNEKTLLPANLSFYALPITKGNHNVIFRYAPQSFYIGSVISGITAFCMILYGAVLWFRYHRRFRLNR